MTTEIAMAGHISSPRRRRLWLVVLAGLPLLLIAIIFALTSRIGTQRLDEAIARTDRLDPRWRHDDIEADRKPFPQGGKNGAEQLLAIDKARPRDYGRWSFPKYQEKPNELAAVREVMDHSLFDDRTTPAVLNEEQVRVLCVELERASEAVRLARDLVNFPRGRHPIAPTKNILSTTLDHAQNARYSVLMLRDDALLRAHNRDISGAILDVKAIVHASRGIGDEPFLVSMLIAMSINQRTISVLERTLGLGEATEQELLEIQNYLLQQAEVPYSSIGFRGERAGLDSVFEGIQGGNLSVSELAAQGGVTGMTGPLGKIQMAYALLTINQQRTDVLNLMTEAVEICKLPTEKQGAEFDFWEKKVKSLDRWHTAGLLLTGLGRVAQADIRNKANLRSAAVGVAAERFRLASGRWPKRLEELVPRFLDELPADPLDGQTLKSKRADGTLIVYSVGIDHVDNGGQIDLPASRPGSDIGFRLFDPDKRRQPARPFVFETKDL